MSDTGAAGSPFYTVVFTNTLIKGSLNVKKTGLEGSDTANLTLWKDNGVAGVSGDDVPYGSNIFSNNETYKWENLPYGNYYILEDFSGITNVFTYSVSNPVWSGNVNGDIGADTPVGVDNTPIKGSLNVKKTGLEGSDTANLTLWKDNGVAGVSGDDVPYGSNIFSNNETYKWENLPYGNYYILEDFSGITNVFTYSVSNPVWSGNVNGDIGADTPVGVDNTPIKGSLNVKKTGLEGSDTANLTLWKDNGVAGVSGDDVPYGSNIFSNNETYKWENLPYGNYYILEDFSGITNVFTYSVSNPVWSGNVNGDIGADTPVGVDNTPIKGSLNVKKTGLEGSDTANLTLWKDNGVAGVSGDDVPYGSNIFSNNETYKWENLPYGNYYILEDFSGITNVFTYSVSNPVWSGNVNGDIGADTPVGVDNTPIKGSLNVKKTGLEGSDTANLTLWKDNGVAGVSGDDVPYGSNIFSNNETYKWENLPYGNYYILEDFSGITNVFTYSVSNPVWSGNVNGDIGADTPVGVDNTPIKGSLNVKKTGLEGSDTANLTLWKDNGVAGVSGDDVPYGSNIFSNNETYKWENLPYGNYYILEDFSGITNVFTYSVSNPVWSGNVNGDIGADTPVGVDNTPIKGSLNVKKTGLEGSDTANLTLWKDNGVAGVSGDDVPYGSNIFSNNETYKWENLPYGNYYILEDFSGITNVFTYSVSNPVWSGNVNGDIGADTPVGVDNTPIKGSLNVKKTGLEGSDTANLTLWKDNGVAGVSGDDVPYGSNIFSNNETYKWENLPYGNYYILEDFSGITNVFTYSVSNPVWSGNVNGDIGADTPVGVINVREKGTIDLIKYLNAEMPPTGTTSFTINWTGSDGSSGSIVLDEGSGWSYDGSAEGFDIYTGVDYTFTEDTSGGFIFVKVVGNDSIEYSGPGFTFTAITGENGSIAFYNATASIIVHKTDSETGEDVEGAEYTLYMDNAGTIIAKDAWGNNVDPQLTDSDGTLTFTGLLLDIYYVKETDAPSGYDIDDIYHQVIVDSDSIGESNEVVIEVEDDPISSPPPPPPPPPPVTPPTTPTLAVAGIEVLGLAFTGVDPIFPIAGIGTVIGGLGLLITSLIRRKKKNTDL